NAAAGLYLPTGPALELARAGVGVARSLRQGELRLTPEDQDALYLGAVSLALLPPYPVYELMLRTGVVEDVDVGLKIATTSVGVDARWRFFRGGDERAMHQHASIGLGASRYLFRNPLFDALELVRIDDFSRWDFEVPLLFSAEYGRIAMGYTGLKYIHTRFRLDQTLYALQGTATLLGAPVLTDSVATPMHFYGAVFGAGMGYQHVFLLVELNVGYVWLRPRLYSFVDDAVRPRNLGGLTVYPAIGLVVATD
ncbi:MAG: hypothetical protein ACK4N5_25860, partial [Myxococcales bacterium]